MVAWNAGDVQRSNLKCNTEETEFISMMIRKLVTAFVGLTACEASAADLFSQQLIERASVARELAQVRSAQNQNQALLPGATLDLEQHQAAQQQAAAAKTDALWRRLLGAHARERNLPAPPSAGPAVRSLQRDRALDAHALQQKIQTQNLEIRLRSSK
jgi:hypothetical protein